MALIDPEIDPIFGVPLPLTAEDVLEALGCVQQRVGAVLVTCPTYEGLCSDVKAIARVRCILLTAILIVSLFFESFLSVVQTFGCKGN